jgi:transposase-like protein
MTNKRNLYSREFREQAVELLNTSGKPGNQM